MTQQYKDRDRQSREQREKLQAELNDKSKAFDHLITESDETKNELSAKIKLLATATEDSQKAKKAVRPPSGPSYSRAPYRATNPFSEWYAWHGRRGASTDRTV